MTLLEGDGARVIGKFNGENFNLQKFKLEWGLASMNLWGIVDNYEETFFSNVDPKVKKIRKTYKKIYIQGTCSMKYLFG